MPSATPIFAYSPAACAHERGPGTSVCLRCRAEAHAAAAARLRRNLVRAGAVVVVLAVAVGVGGGAITAHHGAPQLREASSPLPVAEANVVAQGQPVATSTPSQAVAPSAQSTATPVIDAGRTELTDGMYAERQGGVVTVHFDTELARTRRRDKFENVVRGTLPAVFGERADSILAAIPVGEVARSGDLLTELPTRGITLPRRNGWAITVWPETRPGRDGPLVVSYRATIAAAE